MSQHSVASHQSVVTVIMVRVKEKGWRGALKFIIMHLRLYDRLSFKMILALKATRRQTFADRVSPERSAFSTKKFLVHHVRLPDSSIHSMKSIDASLPMITTRALLAVPLPA